MDYKLDNLTWGSVFAVPCDLIDQQLKLCSGVALKVLVLFMRHDRQFSLTEISQLIGASLEDTHDALNYWKNNAVISSEPTKEQPKDQTEVQLTNTLSYTPENKQEQQAPKPQKERPNLTAKMVNEMAKTDDTIASLLQEIQQVMGRLLTPVATDVFVALYSYYGMKPDLILMLIQYCMSMGKDSVRYIEKVAASWMEAGIDTHELAEKEIVKAVARKSWEGKVKTALGIYDRSLIPAEQKYVHTWIFEYNMDIPLITIAHERTVETKGKLSFSYINGILRNWKEKGVNTPAQAMEEIRAGKFKTKTDVKTQERSSSYDIDELEYMIAHAKI